MPAILIIEIGFLKGSLRLPFKKPISIMRIAGIYSDLLNSVETPSKIKKQIFSGAAKPLH